MERNWYFFDKMNHDKEDKRPTSLNGHLSIKAHTQPVEESHVCISLSFILEQKNYDIKMKTTSVPEIFYKGLRNLKF